jgi:hypothetical protein
MNNYLPLPRDPFRNLIHVLDLMMLSKISCCSTMNVDVDIVE